VTRRLPAPSFFLVTLLALAAPTAADEHIPAVQAELADLYQRLDAIVGNADATPAHKQSLVADELDRRLDYGYLAAAALGPQIEGFSREQFAGFAHAYARFLQDFFVGMVATAEKTELEILETRETDEGFVAVRAASKPRRGVIPGSLRVPRSPSKGDYVTYLFRKSSGGWRIAGISFGGVDLSTTLRGQLESFLAKNDPDALIAELRRRNAEYRGTNPFEPKG
jgi:ABC-type transporter MlaC component